MYFCSIKTDNMQIYSQLIAQKLSLPEGPVSRTLDLLASGATIPFISRYRKEATGGMNEVQIGEIKQQYEKLIELSKRKETVLKAIEEQEKLTPELQSRIDNCWDATELEDIYLPFKPKKQTRAEIARQKGLEVLAKLIMGQRREDIYDCANRFVTAEVATIEDALQGARDIIAEWMNESEIIRNKIRHFFRREAVITSKVIKGKEGEAAKYRDYFNFSEPLAKCSSHRLLAMRRGAAEDFLRVSISPNDTHVWEAIQNIYIKQDGNSDAIEQINTAKQDAYKRLLKPAIETEFAAAAKETADRQAIKVFVENLRQLLLAPPLGQKRVLAIDPGFRTGCKIVCLDAQGNLLHNETIYPHPPQNELTKASMKILSLVGAYDVEAVAIGNGTAGRETEQFIKNLRFDHNVQVFAVSEDGASVYSASKIAREEFPDYDVTVRGAVSIGRRLMDPLAELVKIEPKSIGVGQYQHDVNQTDLKQALDQTVENCVNQVGVNLNTASYFLLTYISGLGTALAKNIVEYRAANGAFRSRQELLKVPRLGAKAFEQSAGFLRIPDATNPLDNSAVHPESYYIVEKMAQDLHCKVSDLIGNAELRNQIQLEQYVDDKTGMPTLLDIKAELEKPGRDPRQDVKIFSFDETIRTIDDLKVGMILPGIVTNITNFGCFVDIGIKDKGLVHVSNMAEKYVSDPTRVVSMHQHVQVKVLSIDMERRRIQLSLNISGQ
jgi:uncharacterized protein